MLPVVDYQQENGSLADEIGGGQLVDLYAADGGVEVPVEVFQGLEMMEVGGFGATVQEAFLAHVEFILKDQFQELGVG